MKMTIPMLDLVRLHAPLKEQMQAAFTKVLESGQFIGGPSIEKFEQQLAEHVGVEFAIAVSSGTDALLATMMSLDVRPGDEIITTPYTFFATAGSIARLGAKPVFVNIDPVTFNIDPKTIKAAITDRTVGILPVHLFGQCAQMDPILDIAKQKNLWVLEDAAQAIGATYNGKQAGTMGVAGTFSFFPAKNLGCLGDGGAVVTNDEQLANRIRSIRSHGSSRKYYHQEVGGNFRLDAVQAEFLSIKLPHLHSWENGRRSVAARYDRLLGQLSQLTLPRETTGRHVYNQYVIQTPARNKLQAAFNDAKIGSAIYYPMPLHMQKCFEPLGYHEGEFINAETAARQTLAIPIDPLLQEDAQLHIAQKIKETLNA